MPLLRIESFEAKASKSSLALDYVAMSSIQSAKRKVLHSHSHGLLLILVPVKWSNLNMNL